MVFVPGAVRRTDRRARSRWLQAVAANVLRALQDRRIGTAKLMLREVAEVRP